MVMDMTCDVSAEAVAVPSGNSICVSISRYQRKELGSDATI